MPGPLEHHYIVHIYKIRGKMRGFKKKIIFQ